MNFEKKNYLGKYLIQQAKINRLNQMITISPDLKENLLGQIHEAEALRDEIEKKINNVDGGILSELLFLKYVCGKPLMEISYCLNYSKRQIERLHIKALKKFEI